MLGTLLCISGWLRTDQVVPHVSKGQCDGLELREFDRWEPTFPPCLLVDISNPLKYTRTYRSGNLRQYRRRDLPPS